MFVENIFESRPGHGSSLGVHEQFGYKLRSSNYTPGAEVSRRFLPERKTSFPPALAENANARRSLEAHILQREPHQFRDAQPSCKAEV
jgi:hypothetical protein